MNMTMNTSKFFLMIAGLAFCFIGCDSEHSERDNLLQPDNTLSENGQASSMDGVALANAETTFEQNLLPTTSISGHTKLSLEAQRTRMYLFQAMPEAAILLKKLSLAECRLTVPRLTAAQIQLFTDWINQQDRADFPNLRYDDDDDDDDDDHDDDDNDHD